MRDPAALQPRSLLDRAARIAFTFVMMNAAAVVALGCAVFRRKVWR